MLATDSIVGSLRLESQGPDRYRAGNVDAGHGVIFGGQLMAQAVMAALAGDDGMRVKTVHTVFARGGRPDSPVEIVVDRMHRGRAFASATVTISQGDRLCTRSQVLLTADEPDFIRHADPGPGASAPTDDAGDGWQIQVVDGVDIADPEAVGPPELDVWVRFAGAPADPAVDQALLAFASDGFLIGTAMRPHAGVGQSQAHVTVATAVVSHTLTFHEPCSPGEWLLLSHRSSYAGRGRGYGWANVFRSDGSLVASFVQDALIRSASGPEGGDGHG